MVGLGRRSRSVPPSAPQPYVDPEVLMDQLKDKDDRIAALEQKMADQEAGWEATRKQNEQMMEMMKRMYPNEQFPQFLFFFRNSECFILVCTTLNII